MKIKRYIGKDSQEAMTKVRMELGRDAIILSTRKFKQKGLTNVFKKPIVEVLAAIDDMPNKIKHKHTDKEILPIHNNLVSHKNKDSIKDESTYDIENKVKNIEQLLKRIYTRVENINNSYENDDKADKVSKMVNFFTNNLIYNGVDSSIASEIALEVKAISDDNCDINDIAAKIYTNIVNKLGKPEPLSINTFNESKVVLFIGPTGVGKTTTIAKIAAMFTIEYKKRVGIISADTYRIAAVEQLKTYAEILGLPFDVIYSPEEINDAVSKFSDMDLILVDTAGKSHKDDQQELKQLITVSNPKDIFLLVSLTTDINVCKEIIKSYSFLDDYNGYKFIFTKMDETSTCGIILNAIKMSNKKLSYITTGQSVPDDIETADVDKIVKKLLGSKQE